MATSRKRVAPLKEDTVEMTSGSVDQTQALGEQLGRLLRAGDVVAMYGELGSGKTTLIQGIARGLGRDSRTIKSPTFVLMREYPPGPPVAGAARPGGHEGRAGGAGGEVPVIHIDGYRLEGAPAVAWLDLDLIFSPHKITFIEWAERFTDALPADHLVIRLTHVSANRRKLQLNGTGQRSNGVVAQLRSVTTTSSTQEAGAEATE